MMKLLYLIPGRMSADATAVAEMTRRQTIMQHVAADGTVVEVADTVTGPLSIESFYDEYLSIPPMLERARQAERDGFDGIILGCYADPGIDALREILSIPVVGPFESSCFAAMTLGHRFSIITATPAMCDALETLFLVKGCNPNRLASVRAIDVDVNAINSQPELVRKRLFEATRTAVLEDRADTVVLGCISLAFSGFGDALSEHFGLPSVNPILTALKDCEGRVQLNLRHSRLAYPLPRKWGHNAT